MFPFAFSAGEAAAATALPRGACDCHLHLYDSRHPAVPGAALQPPDASVAQYRQVQRRMGTTRAVLVTPSTYGTDNNAMLEGLAQLGSAARGVAVISGREDDAELARLHAAGVRGATLADKLGVTLVGGTRQHLTEVQKADSATWAKVIREGHIKAD